MPNTIRSWENLLLKMWFFGMMPSRESLRVKETAPAARKAAHKDMLALSRLKRAELLKLAKQFQLQFVVPDLEMLRVEELKDYLYRIQEDGTLLEKALLVKTQKTSSEKAPCSQSRKECEPTAPQ